MKKKIQYLEKYYCVFLSFICIIAFCLFFCQTIFKKMYELLFIPIFLIILFSFFIFISLNYNIIFDYDKKRITVLYPGNLKKEKIDFNNIKSICFKEKQTQKKQRSFISYFYIGGLYHFFPQYTYNNGKIYFLEITKKDRSVFRIYYCSLYSCRNIKTIQLFESRIKAIIDEFNDYKFHVLIMRKSDTYGKL